MTREEAQKELDNILNLESCKGVRDFHYCPDIKSMCRLDCILFVKTTGEICYKNGDKTNGWEVNLHNGYCRRHMK